MVHHAAHSKEKEVRYIKTSSQLCQAQIKTFRRITSEGFLKVPWMQATWQSCPPHPPTGDQAGPRLRREV
jgi:hypothetical protein